MIQVEINRAKKDFGSKISNEEKDNKLPKQYVNLFVYINILKAIIYKLHIYTHIYTHTQLVYICVYMCSL